MRKIIIGAACALGISSTAWAEIEIPRSVAGDKGRYYLIEAKRTADIVSSLHKRVGVDYTGYTRTETNCATTQMREMGYSEESPEKIKISPSNWGSIVPGSSKADLAALVCKLP